MHQRRFAPLLLLVALTLLLVPLAGMSAANETPILQPGKQSLFERVLTRPGARLSETPGEVANGDTRLLTAFSQLYVYERRRAGGAPWLRVGTDTKGANQGWVAEKDTVPWKQQLILVLTNPGAVRDRLVFFDSRASLEKVLKSPRPGDVVGPLVRDIAQGRRDPRVVALEPETYVDIREKFYLLPILDHVQTTLASGESVRLLRIASVTEQEADGGPAPHTGTTAGSAPAAPSEPARQFRAAVVFVIDSTTSMGPYIEQTKQAVADVYQRLRDAQVIDRVRFGLVAFRAEAKDDARTRDLEYVARAFVDPSQADDAEAFIERVKGLKEAKWSTDYFDEDAFAGVAEALDKTPWQDFDARFIVLITDAGALDGRTMADGLRVESKSGLDAARLASLAGEKQVAITILHLKTPAGVGDHQRAADQYRELARNSRFQTEAYLPIDGGSEKDFRRAVDTLAGAIVANVGENTGRTGTAAAPASRTPQRPAAQPAPADATERNIREIANALGQAMRLRYLGNRTDTRAPILFDAWISDRDFADPTKETVEVRVLLTKNQLSDLQMILQKIVNGAEEGMLKPVQFFDTLRSIATQFGRDPALARSENAKKLADLGLLDEYLGDLPYQSQVMALSQDTWTSWGSEKQVGFTNDLKRKLRQYARYNEDWEGWVNPAQTADASGDFVYPVPLADMP